MNYVLAGNILMTQARKVTTFFFKFGTWPKERPATRWDGQIASKVVAVQDSDISSKNGYRHKTKHQEPNGKAEWPTCADALSK